MFEDSCRHGSSRNKDVIQESTTCGCFYCMSVFPSSEVEDWCDDGQTPICPICGVDAVIGDAGTKKATDKAYLAEMHQKAFGGA